MPWLKFRTIRQNEKISITSVSGKVKVVEGPRFLPIWCGTVRYMQERCASQRQYLRVQHRSGLIEHKKGPITMFFDPELHISITTNECIEINGEEVLVVYKESKDARTGEEITVSRRVIRGPAIFCRGADEWIHEFSWHGADPVDKIRKIPNALQFQKLRTIPDQMYYNVSEVRTKDDGLLRVKIMIFFELEDIEKMLNTTHDPIADIINQVTADIVAFVAVLTYEEFLSRTAELNKIETYKNLTERAELIGYRISKVVYRGYHASNQLQAMHDSNIEQRTRNHLQAEREQQAEEMKDFLLRRETERANHRRELELQEQTHKSTLHQQQVEAQLKQQRAAHEAELSINRERAVLDLEKSRQVHTEEIRYLDSLREIKVDLTQYLVAGLRAPEKWIRIDNGGGSSSSTSVSSINNSKNGSSGTTPQLHLHNV